jgi:hypothetical protein
LRKSIEKVINAIRVVNKLIEVSDKHAGYLNPPKINQIKHVVREYGKRARDNKLINSYEIVWINISPDERFGKTPNECKLFYSQKKKEKNNYRNIIRKQTK